LVPKRLTFILFVALLLRLGFFFVEAPWDEDVLKNTLLVRDALLYHNLSLQLLESFSLDDFIVKVTPGYPFFLYGIYAIFGVQPWVVLIVHMLCDLVSILFVYGIGRAFFREPIALLAAFLFAVDPHKILYGACIYSETLFLTLFLAAVYFLIKGVREAKTVPYAASALFLGMATMVRTISMYYVAIILLVVFLNARWTAVQRLKHACLYVFLFLLTLIPWMVRNEAVYGHFKLVAHEGLVLLRIHATYTEVEKSGRNGDEIFEEFKRTAVAKGWKKGRNPYENDKIYTEVALDYLKENKVYLLRRHIKGILNIYMGLNTELISKMLRIDTKRLDFELYGSPGVMESITRFFRSKTRSEICIGLAIALFLLFCYVSALVGGICILKEKEYILFMILVATILYFNNLNGVLGNDRYKVPVTPFYLLMSAKGIVEVVRIWVNRKGRAGEPSPSS